MSDPIKVKKEGPILEVTIDRPKANAIDSKTSIILGDVFTDFRDNPDLHVAILTGAGEKFFSAGWGLKAVSKGEVADADYGVGGFGGLQELPNMNKPIIGAINGIACGGGLEIMISTDIIIAKKTELNFFVAIFLFVDIFAPFKNKILILNLNFFNLDRFLLSSKTNVTKKFL